MMNVCKRILPVLLLLGLLAVPLSAQNASPRIATIDMGKVSDKYYKWQQAKQVLIKERADLQKDLEELKTSITRETDEFKKLRDRVDDPMVTPEEKRSRETTAQEKANAIQADQASYQELANQGQQKLERHYQELTDLVLQDIQTAVKAKAKTAGFGLVLNTSSDNLQANSSVIYSNGDNDITDEIIKQLNAAQPDSSSNSAASGSTNNASPQRSDK